MCGDCADCDVMVLQTLLFMLLRWLRLTPVFAYVLFMSGNFDIMFGHFSRSCQLHAAPRRAAWWTLLGALC